MNNKVIVIWGFIIIALVTSIYLIGINKNKKEDYTEFKEILEIGLEDYLDDFDMWPNTGEVKEVILEDLLDKEYISSLAYNDRVCKGVIKVERVKSKYNYNYNIECIKKISE